MPAIQTNYSTVMRPALAGMIADMTPRQVISRVVESATGIGFGVIAVQGTGDLQVRPATAGATAFVGITIMDPAVVHMTPQANPDFYPDKDICSILLQGTIWVLVGAAVTAGSPAFYVPATGVITNVGTGNTAIPNGRFDTSAASGALAKLRIV